MTALRYATARLLCSIGFTFKSKRLNDLAMEAHLLREAEEVLGYNCWQEVKNIDDLSSEYWNIHDFKIDRAQKFERLSHLKTQFQNKQTEHQGILAGANQKSVDAREERKQAVQKAEKLSNDRDTCIAEATRLRHLFDGQQTKLKVILQTPEGNTSEEAQVARTKLADIRKQFEKQKEKRQQIADEIAHLNAFIADIDQKISIMNSEAQNKASDSATLVGNIREISNLQAEVGQIDKKISLLYMKIGNHLSRHYETDKACEEASRAAGQLVNKIIALRDSIVYNNKLIQLIGH